MHYDNSIIREIIQNITTKLHSVSSDSLDGYSGSKTAQCSSRHRHRLLSFAEVSDSRKMRACLVCVYVDYTKCQVMRRLAFDSDEQRKPFPVRFCLMEPRLIKSDTFRLGLAERPSEMHAGPIRCWTINPRRRSFPMNPRDAERIPWRA